MTQYKINGITLMILGFIIPVIFSWVIFVLYNDTSADDLSSKVFYLISKEQENHFSSYSNNITGVEEIQRRPRRCKEIKEI